MVRPLPGSPGSSFANGSFFASASCSSASVFAGPSGAEPSSSDAFAGVSRSGSTISSRPGRIFAETTM